MVSQIALPDLSFEQLTPALQDALKPRYERLGYLGEIFRLLGSNETSLLALLSFGENAGRTLDPVQKEIVALVVAKATKAEAELFQHEQRSLKIGMPKALVVAIESLDPQHSELDAEMAAIVRLSLGVALGEWQDARSALAATVQLLGDAASVALLMQAGYYVMASALGHVLDLTPPVESIFAND